MWFGGGFMGGGFDIGDGQLKHLVRQFSQCPGERQLVADGGHGCIRWIESGRTNTDQLMALP
jgi:hypothetical protein